MNSCEVDLQFRSAARDAMRRGSKRIVVAAVICDNARVLLVRRAANDFMAGLLELPSGEVQEQEDVVEALHREVHEETGLTIGHLIALLPSFDYYSRSGTLTRQINVAVRAKTTDQVVLAEHDSFRWVRLIEHQTAETSPEVHEVLDACLKVAA